MKEVLPEEYIVSRSKAFKDNGWKWYGENNRRAMTWEEYKDWIKNGGLDRIKWTTDDAE